MREVTSRQRVSAPERDMPYRKASYIPPESRKGGNPGPARAVEIIRGCRLFISPVAASLCCKINTLRLGIAEKTGLTIHDRAPYKTY